MDSVAFNLNGCSVTVAPAVGERLSQTLRERLGARDVKIGCNAGDCGACTVLVDGAPFCACLMPVQQATGCKVETLAGLRAETAPLAAAFQAHGAAQCGICTPGMMVSAMALLRTHPHPTETQVQDALGGVLCRCTGYRKIIDAVMTVGAVIASHDGSIGTSIARLDGLAKVTGSEAFGDDIAPPRTLELRIIRSPHAHATFTIGDTSSLTAKGITAILTATDVPGLNAFGVIPAFVDQPVFAETTVRFRGEAVACIAAPPEMMRHWSDTDFPITWHPLPAIQTMEQALGGDLLHPTRPENIMCAGRVQCGDANAALARADVTVTGHFQTGFVEHATIEPEAGFAQIVNNRVEIHACTQAPVMDLESLALILNRPKSDIRIIPTAVGGGFGSKLDLSIQPYLALAAIKTGQPVRLTYSRTESMASTTKRHPADMRVTIGATKDGHLCGMTFHGDFNTGAYASWGPTVANRVPVHASGPYRIADYRAQTRAIHTHLVPAGAFRGFGVPQAAIAQEQLFDDLADKLGIDALEFRILNALDNGTPTVCGQVFDAGVGIRDCLIALRPAWAAMQAKVTAFNAKGLPQRMGVGVAAGWYGCGNTSLPNPSTIKAGITSDGRIVLHQGAVDIGQGSNTVITQIFARALGVPVEQVHLIGPDTDITPDAGKTSASRQTFVSGNAARLAGLSLRAQLLAQVNAGDAAVLTFAGASVQIADAELTHIIRLPDVPGYAFEATETYDPPTKPLDANGQGAPYAQFGYAAHLAVVQVDMDLGTVRPLHFTAAHDVGRAINPMLVEGQVHGGIAQGLGMALMEEFIPGRTENLHDYLIPTIGDVPAIDTIIVEVPDPHGPYGAKGLGEHTLIPTAPAILNAIRRATGVRLYHVPATPARVRAAIKGLE